MFEPKLPASIDDIHLDQLDFWIAPGVMLLTVVMVVALFIGYFAKVVWPKTPRR